MLRQLAPGVYEDVHTGEVTVHRSELNGGISGVGDDDGYGEDVDISGILDNDDAYGDDDAAALRYLIGEIGRIKNPKRRRRVEERMEKRVGRIDKRAERRGIDLDNTTRDTDGKDKMKGWTGTALAGSYVAGGAGSSNVTITPQHRFRANNLKAIGPALSTVNSIQFGDKLIWQSATGVPVEFLGATSTLQALVAGAEIQAGLSMIFNVTASGAGTVTVLVDGFKPSPNC